MGNLHAFLKNESALNSLCLFTEAVMRISIGIVIAIALIFYWWMKDHPNALNHSAAPATVQVSH